MRLFDTLTSLGQAADELAERRLAAARWLIRRRRADEASRGEVKRGVLLCGSGLGMAYTANRHPHVRAAIAWTPEIAALARKHNDANVLVLPARFVSDGQGEAILRTWLETPFEGGRHERRVEKIKLPGKK